MTRDAGPAAREGSGEDELRRRISKLERINAALMSHVERVTDKHEGAYSLFQTAIMLDGRVRRRTEELTGLMHRLEQSNQALEAARDEAERANRSKTRFLAAASHDLLQPLHATRLSISMLSDLPLQADAARAVRRVERGLENIEELIRTLLDISKLDAGVVQPHRGAVAMAELIEEIEAEFRQQAEARGLRLVARCAPGLVADSDAALLKRIVGNLVSNAVRYTERGGVVLAARRRGEGCRIDVVDSGCGIPAGERDLVFEEFFRGGTSGSDGKGLGLGLAIVRQMTSTLGHALAFRSRVGHGCWFRLSLPLGQGAPPRCPPRSPHEASVAAVSFAELRVLLLEDPAAPLARVQALLRSWKMTVFVASNAVAPPRPRNGRQPDLVILDASGGGEERTARLVAMLRTRERREVPAVILVDRILGAESLARLTACATMRKPVKPAQLRSLISFLTQQGADPLAAQGQARGDHGAAG